MKLDQSKLDYYNLNSSTFFSRRYLNVNAATDVLRAHCAPTPEEFFNCIFFNCNVPVDCEILYNKNHFKKCIEEVNSGKWEPIEKNEFEHTCLCSVMATLVNKRNVLKIIDGYHRLAYSYVNSLNRLYTKLNSEYDPKPGMVICIY